VVGDCEFLSPVLDIALHNLKVCEIILCVSGMEKVSLFLFIRNPEMFENKLC